MLKYLTTTSAGPNWFEALIVVAALAAFAALWLRQAVAL